MWVGVGILAGALSGQHQSRPALCDPSVIATRATCCAKPPDAMATPIDDGDSYAKFVS